MIVLCAVAALGWAMRGYRLGADPSAWSYVFNTDEGHYSFNTQNRLNHGRWFVDEAKYALITPLFSLGQWAVAAAAPGPYRIAHYRAISVVCGVASCLAMALFFRRRAMRCAAVALASLSFVGIVHSRLGIPEMMLTLFAQLSVAAAWYAHRRRSVALAVLGGALAAGCVFIKPTGVIMLPVLLAAPLMCTMSGKRRMRYWLGVLCGMALAAVLWAAVILIPWWDSWRYMNAAATSMGRESIGDNPLDLVKSFSRLLVSPALQTMPLLWPLSLCWCVIVGAAVVRRKRVQLLDALLILWLLAAAGMVGMSSYQPCRWQVILFPPVICAGLRFVMNQRRRMIAVSAVCLALLLSAAYTRTMAAPFFQFSGRGEPAAGMLSHIHLLGLCLLVAAAGFAVTRSFTTRKWHAFAGAVVAVELTVQALFLYAYQWPTYGQTNQWHRMAEQLETMSAAGDVNFTGDLVQDLSLRADIRVMPTYYLVTRPTDESLRAFYSRQASVPTHALLIYATAAKYRRDAPLFFNCLTPLQMHRLYIGGLGRRTVVLCRFNSYDWLSDQ